MARLPGFPDLVVVELRTGSGPLPAYLRPTHREHGTSCEVRVAPRAWAASPPAWAPAAAPGPGAAGEGEHRLEDAAAPRPRRPAFALSARVERRLDARREPACRCKGGPGRG